MTAIKIHQTELSINTSGRGTQNITHDIQNLIKELNVKTGLCHIFLKHTSASLILCENYDEQVRHDLENFLVTLIPDGDPMFKHIEEGSDDMPAHIRTILTQSDLNIPIANGELVLGTWQGIFLYEHRHHAHKRNLVITVIG